MDTGLVRHDMVTVTQSNIDTLLVLVYMDTVTQSDGFGVSSIFCFAVYLVLSDMMRYERKYTTNNFWSADAS